MADSGTVVGPIPDNANEREFCDNLCSFVYLAFRSKAFLIPYPRSLLYICYSSHLMSSEIRHQRDTCRSCISLSPRVSERRRQNSSWNLTADAYKCLIVHDA